MAQGVYDNSRASVLLFNKSGRAAIANVIRNTSFSNGLFGSSAIHYGACGDGANSRQDPSRSNRPGFRPRKRIGAGWVKRPVAIGIDTERRRNTLAARSDPFGAR